MIDNTKFFNDAVLIQDLLVEIRRKLHMYPEVGFDLFFTRKYIKKILTNAGYDVFDVAGSLCAILKGNNKTNKTILLRADMDALKILEETTVSYKSKNNGYMHACGHDMHAAMLIGAALILKRYEGCFDGNIKFLFQAAEETFLGAKSVISTGIIDDVTAAFMLHVVSNSGYKNGTILLPPSIAAVACECFEIELKGESAHSGLLNKSSIESCAKLILLLAEKGIKTSFCNGGTSFNVLPRSIKIGGTIRSNSDLPHFKETINEAICTIKKDENIDIFVRYFAYCPNLKLDSKIMNLAKIGLKETFKIDVIELNSTGMGSEDFANISALVPSGCAILCAGNDYSMHSSKVIFDDTYLYVGSLIYINMAYNYLKSQ